MKGLLCCCPFLLHQGRRSTFPSVLTATHTSAPPVQVCSLVDHIRSFRLLISNQLPGAECVQLSTFLHLKPPSALEAVRKPVSLKSRPLFFFPLFDLSVSRQRRQQKSCFSRRLAAYHRPGCVPEVTVVVLFSRNKLEDRLTKLLPCLKLVFRTGEDAEPWEKRYCSESRKLKKKNLSFESNKFNVTVSCLDFRWWSFSSFFYTVKARWELALIILFIGFAFVFMPVWVKV